MKDPRPINLNLFTIRFPLPAIISILHRISGAILFFLIPLILWGLNLSLESPQGFDNFKQLLTTPWIKFIIWCICAAFIYHLIAGIRHLMMDVGIGEGLKSGKLGAQITLFLSSILIIIVGIWLW